MTSPLVQFEEKATVLHLNDSSGDAGEAVSLVTDARGETTVSEMVTFRRALIVPARDCSFFHIREIIKDGFAYYKENFPC